MTTDNSSQSQVDKTIVTESGTMPTTHQQGMPWWFWHIFTAVGLILLFTGVFVLRSEIAFAKHSKLATGMVIGYTQHRDIDDDVWMYAPIVQFETADGKSIEFTSSTRSSSRPYNVGADVKILYDPNDPQRAKLAAAAIRYMLPTILLLLGSVFTALGLFGHFYIRPRLILAN